MPSFLESCQDLFGTKDLYEILGVSKTASEKELKKGYYKTSLKVHPDRVDDGEKETATLKFQALGKVYVILTDKDKRSVYDESGDVDEDDDAIPADRDWVEYWRLLYPKISLKDVVDFEKSYKDSEEEMNDLKAAYLESKGNMDHIIDSVMCATVDDEGRFRSIINDLIKQKELPKYKDFSKDVKHKNEKRKRKAALEAEEATDLAKELGLNDNGGEDALRAMILQKNQSRQQNMDNFFSRLEEKYAKPKKGKKKASSRS